VPFACPRIGNILERSDKNRNHFSRRDQTRMDFHFFEREKQECLMTHPDQQVRLRQSSDFTWTDETHPYSFSKK
jgi:hypothetical protein